MVVVSVVCCGRVNNLGDFGDSGERDTTHLSVLLDRGLSICEINTEGFVASNITVLPLDSVANCIQCLIGRTRRATKFCHRKRPDAGDIALDHITFHNVHGMSFLLVV
jgi:hypothetical protein